MWIVDQLGQLQNSLRLRLHQSSHNFQPKFDWWTTVMFWVPRNLYLFRASIYQSTKIWLFPFLPMYSHSSKRPQFLLGKCLGKIYSMFLEQWYGVLPQGDLPSL